GSISSVRSGRRPVCRQNGSRRCAMPSIAPWPIQRCSLTPRRRRSASSRCVAARLRRSSRRPIGRRLTLPPRPHRCWAGDVIAGLQMESSRARRTRSAPSPQRGEGWGEGVTTLSIDPNPLTRLPRFGWKSTSPLRGEVKAAARSLTSLLGLVLVALLALPAPVPAQTVEQFYRGRTVAIVVGFATGGAYDPYARLVARHLPKYLPGSPNIVVRNMQGAGSVIAANHVYNVSPKDGSELGVIAGSAAIEPVFGGKSVQFDGQKFTWIGSANNEIAGCLAWHASPFERASDLFEKEMITGASG